MYIQIIDTTFHKYIQIVINQMNMAHRTPYSSLLLVYLIFINKNIFDNIAKILQTFAHLRNVIELLFVQGKRLRRRHTFNRARTANLTHERTPQFVHLALNQIITWSSK